MEPLLLEGQVGLAGPWSYTHFSTSSLLSLSSRFKKFNDRVLRRILLRDNRAESSIVSLYKKLELQNAIELLDTTMGDISAAPSVVSLKYVMPPCVLFTLHFYSAFASFRKKPQDDLRKVLVNFLLIPHSSESTNQLTCYISPLCSGFSDDRKEASRPKKTFRATDVRKMHDLLTKNMYKIRQKVRKQQQQ